MSEIKRLNDYQREVPKSYAEGMLVPGIMYIDDELFNSIKNEGSISQVVNSTMLPGIVKAAIAMPDMHYGYGLPIGGVVATDAENGVIVPGGVGFDINCGVRLLVTNLEKDDVKFKVQDIINDLHRTIPAGVGEGGPIKLSKSELKKVCQKGARWSIEHGAGSENDAHYIEEGGTLDGAEPDFVSDKAFERGARQLGTLGSGNHFLELQYISEIYDPATADTFGIRENQVALMIHTGSRGFGHQICTDYLALMNRCLDKYKIHVPDRQLCCVPVNSKEGESYYKAMASAANYAWANRQYLVKYVFDVMLDVLEISPKELGLRTLYDVAHNIVKKETHIVDGKKMRLAVHRKGATRAFPKGALPKDSPFYNTGHPVIVPGSIGTDSYILAGTQKGLENTFGSSCHGAGRVMSRHQAIKQAKGRSISRELEDIGIIARAVSNKTLIEEMPDAYKDIDKIVNVMHGAGIAMKIARLSPLGAIKG
jgi:tRNA-splicing ligase RtcB (3'-phosphate/5'-hydroxy nucleic acid ligase)